MIYIDYKPTIKDVSFLPILHLGYVLRHEPTVLRNVFQDKFVDWVCLCHELIKSIASMRLTYPSLICVLYIPPTRIIPIIKIFVVAIVKSSSSLLPSFLSSEPPIDSANSFFGCRTISLSFGFSLNDGFTSIDPRSLKFETRTASRSGSLESCGCMKHLRKAISSITEPTLTDPIYLFK